MHIKDVVMEKYNTQFVIDYHTAIVLSKSQIDSISNGKNGSSRSSRNAPTVGTIEGLLKIFKVAAEYNMLIFIVVGDVDSNTSCFQSDEVKPKMRTRFTYENGRQQLSKDKDETWPAMFKPYIIGKRNVVLVSSQGRDGDELIAILQKRHVSKVLVCSTYDGSLIEPELGPLLRSGFEVAVISDSKMLAIPSDRNEDRFAKYHAHRTSKQWITTDEYVNLMIARENRVILGGLF